MADSVKLAKEALRIISPMSGALIDLMTKSNASVEEASDKGLEDLKAEVAKQNVRMSFDERRAKVAQELAIAARIENADEVEIEEFYDTTGKGSLGLNIDATAKLGSLGLGGEGRLVTKRIYRFKGLRNTAVIEASAMDDTVQRSEP